MYALISHLSYLIALQSSLPRKRQLLPHSSGPMFSCCTCGVSLSAPTRFNKKGPIKTLFRLPSHAAPLEELRLKLRCISWKFGRPFQPKQLGFFIPTLFIDRLMQKVLILRYLRGFFELPPCTAEGDNSTEY